jgi:hypothetical protein
VSRDRDALELLALAEGGKLGAAHHRTVVIHELGKHADRRQTGEAGQIRTLV